MEEWDAVGPANLRGLFAGGTYYVPLVTKGLSEILPKYLHFTGSFMF
jgi:hypothetical protein